MTRRRLHREPSTQQPLTQVVHVVLVHFAQLATLVRRQDLDRLRRAWQDRRRQRRREYEPGGVRTNHVDQQRIRRCKTKPSTLERLNATSVPMYPPMLPYAFPNVPDTMSIRWRTSSRSPTPAPCSPYRPTACTSSTNVNAPYLFDTSHISCWQSGLVGAFRFVPARLPVTDRWRRSWSGRFRKRRSWERPYRRIWAVPRGERGRCAGICASEPCCCRCPGSSRRDCRRRKICGILRKKTGCNRCGGGQVSFTWQGFGEGVQGRVVGDEARGEQQRRFLIMQARQLVFEVFMQEGVAGNVSSTAGTSSVLVKRFPIKRTKTKTWSVVYFKCAYFLAWNNDKRKKKYFYLISW